MGAAINVGEVYAHIVRDVRAGTYSTPGFDHAPHNARLINVVRRAAGGGERQRVVESIESLDARVTSRTYTGITTSGPRIHLAEKRAIRRSDAPRLWRLLCERKTKSH
jgi:hypothetical protein